MTDIARGVVGQEYLRKSIELLTRGTADAEVLENTPARFSKAMLELTSGYDDNPKAILSRVFNQEHDEMVVVRGIDFTSVCEHHLLPFNGTAVVGYLPLGKFVGLSKIPRLVQCFAKRLQLQERMTSQIAHAREEYLSPGGVGVMIRARHSCMSSRGVRCQRGEMVTSALRGSMRSNAAARAEFLELARA